MIDGSRRLKNKAMFSFSLLNWCKQVPQLWKKSAQEGKNGFAPVTVRHIPV
jgi:hypothetical protein